MLLITVNDAREAIRDALQKIASWSPAAEDLVIGTWAQESELRYVVQLGGGPGRGLGQMEEATHDSLWANFIVFHPELEASIRALVAPAEPAFALLETSPAYMAVMTRVRYLDSPHAIPVLGDVAGYAGYWKRNYNTPEGAGTPEEFLAHWDSIVLGNAPAADEPEPVVAAVEPEPAPAAEPSPDAIVAAAIDGAAS